MVLPEASCWLLVPCGCIEICKAGMNMTQITSNKVDWRALWASGDLARFCFISLGILLHATNETMVATVMPAMVGELAGVQLVGWSLAIYELGAIVAGAAAGRLVSY